ncbi:very short patch repair endonuclease [Sphingopyxis sp. XHP0097]|uniref:Very short patch repair endonuclease n=1 Tax=Sphingopyxis jiangsuensis TaxID=2871171 RepID=A0ABS7MHG8_9SPHN|nr:very short patch repair endonuclease [Sphingopyxis jiangsuensis]MBY4638358.1 very short patch repair endonuclease [Sphingopyxis jiangsuensis]
MIAPSSPEASKRLSRVRQRDTEAELAVRRALHRRGRRYRVNVKLIDRPRRVADIVFRPKKVAVFVDGCFWHGCPEHGSKSKSNADYWKDKIAGNQKRDRDTDRRLEEAGWKVVRVWEHEDPDKAARRICSILEAQ